MKAAVNVFFRIPGFRWVVKSPGARKLADLFKNIIDINVFAEKGVPYVLPAAGIFDIRFKPPVAHTNDGNRVRGF